MVYLTSPEEGDIPTLEKVLNSDGSPERHGSPLVCGACGGKDVYHDRDKGEHICTTCGVVLSTGRIDEGPEWREFTAEERDDKRRVGPPDDPRRIGLGSHIDWRDTDSSGRRLKASKRSEIYRMRRWQIRSRIHDSKDRNLAKAMSELGLLSTPLGIPPGIQRTTASVYRKILEKKLSRGRSIKAFVAASAYLAFRIHQRSRPLEEIADAAGITRKKLGRHFRLLMRYLNIKAPAPSPTEYVPRITSELGCNDVSELAVKILQATRSEGGCIGKDPLGLAAAAIYISSVICGNRRTQREIGEIATVTEVTVRNRYKNMVRRLGLEDMSIGVDEVMDKMDRIIESGEAMDYDDQLTDIVERLDIDLMSPDLILMEIRDDHLRYALTDLRLDSYTDPQKALEVSRKIVEETMSKDLEYKSGESAAMASLFTAMRIQEAPVTLEDIINISKMILQNESEIPKEKFKGDIMDDYWSISDIRGILPPSLDIRSFAERISKLAYSRKELENGCGDVVSCLIDKLRNYEVMIEKPFATSGAVVYLVAEKRDLDDINVIENRLVKYTPAYRSEIREYVGKLKEIEEINECFG